MLNGNDFHHENVISSGEFPYLIHLKTLFNQNISIKTEDIFDYNSLGMHDSINRTCFLPSNTGFIDENGNGVDIS